MMLSLSSNLIAKLILDVTSRYLSCSKLVHTNANAILGFSDETILRAKLIKITFLKKIQILILEHIIDQFLLTS